MNTRRERQRLIEATIRMIGEQAHLTDRQLRTAIYRAITASPAQKNISLEQKQKLADQILADMRGFDILNELFEDSDITEIMVNGYDKIFIERKGQITQANLSFEDEDHVRIFIERCFGRADRLISRQQPIAGMRLDDGSRVQAVINPAAVNGPYLSIRRYKGIRPQIEQMIKAGFLDDNTSVYLCQAVQDRKNIFISGGTGSGKTTFLNALSAYIPGNERIVTIEDEAELDLQGIENLVSLQARLPGPDGSGEITLSDLIRLSLRLRPDRIIVGEVRSKETYDMIQAMHTGHPGSMSTGHGNSCFDMLERLSLMLIMHSNLPWEACRRLVCQATDLVIQIERGENGHRHIKEIIEVDGYANNSFATRQIFCFGKTDGTC